jgi:hypothetical protein
MRIALPFTKAVRRFFSRGGQQNALECGAGYLHSLAERILLLQTLEILQTDQLPSSSSFRGCFSRACTPAFFRGIKIENGRDVFEIFLHFVGLPFYSAPSFSECRIRKHVFCSRKSVRAAFALRSGIQSTDI